MNRIEIAKGIVDPKKIVMAIKGKGCYEKAGC